jgi:hypothetical protein
VIGGVLVLALAGGAAPVRAESAKAGEILAAARKALGGGTLEGLKTFSLDASLHRNIGSVQMASEVEILLDLPDRYLRSDVSSGMMNSTMATGFNGGKPIIPAGATALPGGGMMIRIGPGPAAPAAEKLSPEQQARADEALLRSSRVDISRMMLGWFATAHPSLPVQYTYAGEAESPDGKAHVIDVKDPEGFSARLFIDQESKLPLMLRYQGPQPRVVTAGGPRAAAGPGAHATERRELTDQERRKLSEDTEKRLKDLQSQPPAMADFTLYFDEWREADGVRFPHRIRRAMSGDTNEEWTVNKVRVNPKIDAKKFEG